MQLERNKILNFLLKANKIHNKYDYSKSIYINNKTKLIIICKIHGEFEQTPNNHLNGNGCPKCSKVLSIEDFVIKAKSIHGDRYDYSKSVYINSKIKLIIICKIHGEFEQNSANHLLGKNCNKCSKTYSPNTKEFIEKANLVHNFKYDYEKCTYTKSHNKIIISCKEHGDFKQSPHDHLFGYGCIKCSGNYTSNIKEFIIKANKIHSFKYNYSKSNYINNKTKLIIICKKHNEFEQAPNSHLTGAGCPRCISSISKKEIEWLNNLNVSELYRHKTIKINNKKYKVDAFNPLTNTVYEFYGDFWHGNPLKFKPEDINDKTKTSFGKLYQKTIDRENIIKSAGFNLITIWEHEFSR